MANIPSPPGDADSDGSGSFFTEKSGGDRSDMSEEDTRVPSPEESEHERLRSRIIVVHVEEGNNLIKSGEISLYECNGYYTFALEIKGVSMEEDRGKMSTLTHVCWPWGPYYSKAEYFGTSSDGSKIDLDPLVMDWEKFFTLVDNVVMKEKELPNEHFIGLQMNKSDGLENEVHPITKSVIKGSYIRLRKILYLYACACTAIDPEKWDWMPLDPAGLFTEIHYYDEAGSELEPPVLSVGDDYDYEEGGGSEDSYPSTETEDEVFNPSDDERAAAMEIDDDDAMDIEDVNNEEGWVARVFRVTFKFQDAAK